ncbi:hypothetical protein HPB51_010540 [Rhipicephalus microplus]|uniref:Uncharacterized protein n=1 Tax=Rhipicephalus microplus TaxID=6941 RepID=A0A9J6D989_RHIMP|nr:hypothetical protein HPB51_010540 [Rhipicephalus microplus]
MGVASLKVSVCIVRIRSGRPRKMAERTAVHDLTIEEEADGPIALSGPLPNGMQSRLRPLSDGRRVFCIYNNRVSERRPSMNFTIEDLKVNFCDDVVYGYVGLDGTSTTIRSKHPKYDFLEEGFKSRNQKCNLFDFHNPCRNAMYQRTQTLYANMPFTMPRLDSRCPPVNFDQPTFSWRAETMEKRYVAHT